MVSLAFLSVTWELDLTLFDFVFSGEEAEEDFVSNWTQSVEKFDDMGLNELILRGLYAFGFQEPSKIQQKGVLPVVQGRDTIA